jgi:protein-S-isoprenylcysteine O-methyltransferase Ste14
MFLQFLCFAAIAMWLIPAVVIEQTRARWPNPLLLASLPGLLLAIPALIGILAVIEFVERGEGTPFPLDPPQHLVTTGIYAYVRNPMQLACTLMWIILFGAIGWQYGLGAGLIAWAYCEGFAKWDERIDLENRFGEAWVRYSREVPRWFPRLTPRRPVPSRPRALSGSWSC